jgi:hypothetical protein
LRLPAPTANYTEKLITEGKTPVLPFFMPIQEGYSWKMGGSATRLVWVLPENGLRVFEEN